MRLWIVLWFIAVALILYPIKNSILRACAILAVSGLWFGLLALCWDRRALRFTLLLLTATIAGFLLLPGGSVDPNTLRQRYVDSLVRYEGTKYVWGGENILGIDCSGLVRKGLINAELREGLSSLNPRLVRQGLSLWWFDSSAQALGDEYRHKTRRLFTTPSINSLDHSRLRPGDFAVTVGGVHTLAYLGGEIWIEADPSVKRVIQVKIPADNPWFKQPVHIMRWVEFEEKRQN